MSSQTLTTGWESGRLVPVSPTEDDAEWGYLPTATRDHPLFVAVRAYTHAMQRVAVARRMPPLPDRFGRVLTRSGYPYVAFSRVEWLAACDTTRRSGFVALGRTVVWHRDGKHRAVPTSQGLRFDRHAPITHGTFQVSAALPRLPRHGRYFRVWMLRTPPLRVEDDRLRGGTLLCAAYDDLWADLGRRVEALIPTALADCLTHGTPV